MVDLFLFVGIIFLVLLSMIILKVKDVKSWASSKEGLGAIFSAIKGIVVVIVFGVIVVLATSWFSKANAQSVLDNKYGHFLNNVYTYAGIDHTFKTSAQCKPGYVDDRLTSNMGFGANLYQSPSRKTHLDLIYHHQSCVLGVDRNSYDAVGLRVTWYPWIRK